MGQGFQIYIFGIFRLTCPPFLKMVVVNTNVTISQKVRTVYAVMLMILHRLVDYIYT